ncbi:protein rep, partial [Staphylococcus epidermidis]|nr:protein rep [Staphylococcus epidermidis]
MQQNQDCAEILEYKQNRETGERKLYRVWFCKSRLCPMCNWRRAMKHG